MTGVSMASRMRAASWPQLATTLATTPRSLMSALSIQYARKNASTTRGSTPVASVARRASTERSGWSAGIVSVTPKRFAQRCMSAMLCSAFAGASVAKSFCGVSLARKTPPSSNGRYVSSTPIRAASAGACVEPRYAYGHV